MVLKDVLCRHLLFSALSCCLCAQLGSLLVASTLKCTMSSVQSSNACQQHASCLRSIVLSFCTLIVAHMKRACHDVAVTCLVRVVHIGLSVRDLLVLQVWGTSWGQPTVPGGIRSLWADVGVSEPKKTNQDAFAAFSTQFHAHSDVSSHQNVPHADVGAGMFNGGWGFNNGMNHRMPHSMNQGMHAMSGTSNQAGFYRY